MQSSNIAVSFVRNIAKPDVSSVMAVAAHPDDEVIGAGGHLRFWPGLTVVHVTNGAPRDPRYAQSLGFPDPSAYAVARRHEAEQALGLIGLSSDRIVALNIDDQEASFRLVEIARQLHRMFTVVRPEVVVTHPYEGGHPDHDAACFAVHAACQLARKTKSPIPAVVEMSSYFGRNGDRVVYSFLEDRPQRATVNLDAAARELKRRMLDCYVSQRDVIGLFPVEIECFRPAPNYDFRNPPHDGRLFYEYHNLGIDGAHWRIAAAEALRELDLANCNSL